MSKGVASFIVLVLVLALTAFFFFGSSLLPGGDAHDSNVLKELTVKRFMSLGNNLPNFL